MNFKKAEGINDMSLKETFKKWPGIPKDMRGGRAPGTAANTARLIADHRKKNLFSVALEKQAELEKSTIGFAESIHENSFRQRNISQTAWNKIRQFEQRKKDRLNFKPWRNEVWKKVGMNRKDW